MKTRTAAKVLQLLTMSQRLMPASSSAGSPKPVSAPGDEVARLTPTDPATAVPTKIPCPESQTYGFGGVKVRSTGRVALRAAT